MMDTVHYSVSAGVDFSFKGQCVGMFSNTIACTVFGTILHTGATVIMLGNFYNFTFIFFKQEMLGSLCAVLLIVRVFYKDISRMRADSKH